jgi:hypothetical protein
MKEVLNNKGISMMSKKINYMFFFHNGYDDYLDITIKQAKVKNPNHKIILLGDKENNKYDYVIHAKILDYSNYANEFLKKFIFLGDRGAFGYYPLLRSYQRWFVILEYMRSNNILDAYYQDSDIILNCNLDEINYDGETWCYTRGGYTPVAFNISLLEKFCEFLLKCYSDTKKLVHLFNMRLNYKLSTLTSVNVGWCTVSEMELMRLFLFENEIQSREISIKEKNTIFSLSGYGDMYLSHQGVNEYDIIKNGNRYYTKFYCKNGELFIKDVALDKFIKLNSVHFAGGIKECMKTFIEFMNIDNDKYMFYDYKTQKWINEDRMNDYRKYIALKDSMYFLQQNKYKNLNDSSLKAIEEFFDLKIEENNLKIEDKLDLIIKTLKHSVYKPLENKLENKKLIGWGSGSGLDILKECYDYNFKFEYLVDSNRDKDGQKKNDLNIYYVDKLLDEIKDEIIVVVLSDSYYNEIKNTLIDMGFEENKNFISMEYIGRVLDED